MTDNAGRIAPGERHSQSTEFKRGQLARNKLPAGAVRERRETNTGLMRAWVKVAEPNVWQKRAIVVWESVHGPLPQGQVVHHRDRNSLNDEPDNLVALTMTAHQAEHELEMAEARVAAARRKHPSNQVLSDEMKRKKSTTAKALAWIDAAPKGEARSVYRAAKLFDLTVPALSRAHKARLGKVACPTCGTLHPKGTRFTT